MRLAELDYELPHGLVAQEPLKERDEARLLVVDRRAGAFEHSRFYKLASHLSEGDLIVLNDTRVLPARLFARKDSGGRVELLLVRPAPSPPGAWIAMARTQRPLREGARLSLDGDASLRIVGYARQGRPLVAPDDGATVEEIIRRYGTLALPDYIRREVQPDDFAAYQTVYASREGAIAAPTAGLHFSERVLRDLADAGIRTAVVTLHIGPGTFAPIRSFDVEGHSMESEWYAIADATVAAIANARRTGGRIVAVGTSTVRALESYAITGDCEGFTGLFIHPGFRFKLVDALITNFHMPRTTVLALVMAFAGRDLILAAYREAVRRRYRFLSYGDAMLIL
jgi:S-adenosylmethionine:tRNA ribosyltransferase-isomerase